MEKKACSLLLTLWMLTLIPSAHAETSTQPEEPSPWAAETVREAAALGIVPEQLQSDWQQDLTRSEFAEVLIRFLAVQYGYGTGTGFTLDEFFEDYLNLHPAPNGEPFSQADYLTQAEVSPTESFSWKGILYDYFRVFEDVKPYGSTTEYINMAYLLGIVKGRDETHFDPSGAITRQEAAVLLARTYESYAALEPRGGICVPFTDNDSIASWAVESVAAMASWDILHGDENHTFLPYDHYTREQGIAAFMRLYKNMPISRCSGTLAPLLTQDDVVEHCLHSTPFAPRVLYRADTELCTVLCLAYGGFMHAPSPAIFLIYPDSTYRRVNLSGTPEDFQLDGHTLTFSDGYLANWYTLNLETGALAEKQ